MADHETSQRPGLVRPRTALAVLCAASFLAVVDTTIVSIALPSIRRVMGLTAGGSQWVLNAYALVFGGLLLLFGQLGDRGRTAANIRHHVPCWIWPCWGSH